MGWKHCASGSLAPLKEFLFLLFSSLLVKKFLPVISAFLLERSIIYEATFSDLMMLLGYLAMLVLVLLLVYRKILNGEIHPSPRLPY